MNASYRKWRQKMKVKFKSFKIVKNVLSKELTHDLVFFSEVEIFFLSVTFDFQFFSPKTGMDQDPLDLVMRGKGSPEDQLLEEIKEVKSSKMLNAQNVQKM